MSIFLAPFLLGTLILPACATEAWSPYPLVWRDSLVAGISVSDKRVLGASRSNLYELDEAKGIWKSVRPGTPQSYIPPNYQSLTATPSAHFLVQGESSYMIQDDSPITALLPQTPCCSQTVSEDSARFYLRLNGSGYVVAMNKATLTWDTLNLLTIQGSYLSSGGRLFVARHDLTGDGIYQSDDRGATWKPVPNLPESRVSFLKPLGADLYVGLDDHGIYRSADGGSHWSPLFPTFPYASYSFTDIEVDGDSVWLITPDSRGQGVLRTVNAGVAWQWLHQGIPAVDNPDSPGGRYYPVQQLAHGSGALWMSDWTSAYRSDDGGLTWTNTADGLMQINSGPAWTLASPGFSGALWGPSGFIQIGSVFSILLRIETGDRVYAWSETTRKWNRDASYPDSGMTWLGAMGDTVYIQAGAALLRRVGPGGAWKSIPLPWNGTLDSTSQWVGEVFHLGTELAITEVGSADGLYLSDDGGNTWNTQNYLFPKARFQGSGLEGRGRTLCWPDDSTFHAPKVWRDFPEPIRGMWVADGKLLVRAGAIIYSAATAGGDWTQTRLPDTAMVLGMRNGALNGYTTDSSWTYSQPGGVWQSRPVVFPYPEVQVLAAGLQESWAQTPVGAFFFKRSGQGERWFDDFVNAKIVSAEAGSYLLMAQGGILDTFNIALQAPTLPILPPGVYRPSTTINITAVLGEESFMAEASGKTDLRISLDRGKTWSVAAKPPGSVSKLAGAPNRMFALADSLLYASTDSAKTWVPLSATGPKFATVAGTVSLLAALPAEGGRVMISKDTARSWTALPALVSGGDTVITDVAVQGGQVLAGTRNAGVFSWGDPTPTAIKPQASHGSGAGARSIRRGWIHLPGQGLRLRLDPNTQIDARGRRSLSPQASGME